MADSLNVVVAGGSVAGLFTSLLLARAGHSVVLLEQELLEVAADVESAARTAYRISAPQIVQPHALMARCRQLLMEELPDIYAQLLAAGVSESPLSTQMSASLSDISPLPGDEQLTFLMTRRATFDWVLRRAVQAEPRIAMRCGLRVRGLLARPGERPHVTGVRTSEFNISAELVVDATGYRSPVDRWLQDLGAQPTSILRAECGLAYFGRQYRLRPGAKPPGPPTTTRVVVGLDEFTVGIWGGDNGSMQIALIPLAQDHRFKQLRYPEVYNALLRTIPFYARWLEVLEPTSEIFPMGAVQNTFRRFVVEGSPVVTGLVAVGDSMCTTNPTLGRGLTFALSNALNLLKVIGNHSDDQTEQMLALDDLVIQQVMPFYQDQVATDKARLAILRHTIFNAPAPEPPASDSNRVNYAQLRAAASFDPLAFRAFWKIMGMVVPPDEVYSDPEIVSRTRAAIDQHGNGSFALQPTHKELLEALATPVRPLS